MFLIIDENGQLDDDTRYDALLTPDESDRYYAVYLLVPDNTIPQFIGLLLDGIFSANWEDFGDLSIEHITQQFQEIIALADWEPAGVLIELQSGGFLSNGDKFIMSPRSNGF